MGTIAECEHESGGPKPALAFKVLVKSGTHREGFCVKRSMGASSWPGALPLGHLSKAADTSLRLISIKSEKALLLLGILGAASVDKESQYPPQSG